MLKIDLKLQGNVTAKPKERVNESNPSGLNAYNSLNRANRIKDLAKIVDQNQEILGRLQGTKSHYNTKAWNNEHEEKEKIVQQWRWRSPRCSLTSAFGTP